MNRTKIKNYAPQARRDFLQAVMDRAAFYGLTADRIEPVTAQGDLAIIGGRAFPNSIVSKRKALQERVERDGFGPTMEALAYTWFNRLVAIRYMELHGYLEHGFRVLSNTDPARSTPEILDQAEHVELPDLKQERVIELKLDGSKEAELYRMLLVAQCNALHTAMPFLFERIGDETELVLPESLLHSDSIVRKLVSGIDEEDWREVEIIGWIYQFYISEKKDAVIGKVVASEDIPAATQLFTPNWIVKYLVQNTLGRHWLATYPQSPLKGQMKYYIEPAEQTPAVQEQLKAITPTSLNPEEITFLDPACGSGHILVEAYDLFKAIYQERGYRAKDIPLLILGKNLFGLEIDDRAAQFAAFALMMKARADDRRTLESKATPNVLAFQNSRGMNAAEITHVLNEPISITNMPSEYMLEKEEAGLLSQKAMSEKGHVSQADIAFLLEMFENAKTFGSLIRISPKLAAKLPYIDQRLDGVLKYGDLTHATAQVIKPLLQQAGLLARQFDAVAANPPYMGSMAMTASLKLFARDNYPLSNTDLFAMFMDRCMDYAAKDRYAALVVMQSWMFLSSFRTLRDHILSDKCLLAMAHLGARAFATITGEIVQVAAYSQCNATITGNRPVFLKLTDGDETSKIAGFSKNENRYSHLVQEDFEKLPGSPIAYWATKAVADAFGQGTPLQDIATICNGIKTGNVELFIKRWFEINSASIGFGFTSQDDAEESEFEWFPYCKGGEFRNWYGNNDHILHWEDKGQKLRSYSPSGGVSNSRDRPENRPFFFKPGVTWSSISSQEFGVRYLDPGMFFDIAGPSLFPHNPGDLNYLIGFMCSSVSEHLLNCLNTTLNILVQDIKVLPLLDRSVETRCKVEAVVSECIELSREDWDAAETSWGFERLPFLSSKGALPTITSQYEAWSQVCEKRIDRLRELEVQNNEIFMSTYNLSGELGSQVAIERVTLYRPKREEDVKRLISYSVGCTMGRYSLDTPGLIYAHGSNVGFDPGQYTTFPADPVGIVPVMEADWFADDAANRLVEFLGVAWPREGLDENLRFVADGLGPNKGEPPRDTIRRYLANGFYKHHLQTYKRRPIYWLFSSGKQRAFQCLVYLHRYHDGTLARMRTEYVIPLQGKLASRIDQLASDILKATSTSHRKTLTQERDKLIKQQAELQSFDEKLRHYADMKITLDLDDGVKVNYGKFGDLLAEVKAVTGGRDDD